MSDVDRLTGQRPGATPGSREAQRTRTPFVSTSWVGVIIAFAFGSLAAVSTTFPRTHEGEATARQLPPLTLALRSPVARNSSPTRGAGPLLTLGDEPPADTEPVAGPVLITDDSPPQLSLGGPEIPVEGYASTATVPLARPLPLFRESDTLQIVPPEGMVATAPLPTPPIPTGAPSTGAPSTGAPSAGSALTTAPPPSAAPRSTATIPTTKAKKSRAEKASTTTQVPNPQPLVVPPEGLVIPAPGSVIAPPPASATLPPPSPILAGVPPTTATPTPPTTTPPGAAAPTTVPPPTTAAPTTIARTSTTLVFIPLPPSTAPRVAPLPQTPPNSATPTTAPGRVPVGPFPTIDVRPVTETRTAPPLPAGTETPVPTTTPFSTEPKIFTFIAATEPAPPVHPLAALVAETAKSLLGAPYVWGGEGPGYDCSGLSVVAWRAAGVNLIHQSRAQFAATTRVNLVDIAVGDLVFYGEPIHHLGIYIGDGKMIEAPRVGINVRITSIKRRDLIGIGRVTG